MNYAIILAGGVGRRFGTAVPKQFVEVLGKPLIIYTLERFQNHPEIDAIELVCLDGYQDDLWEMAAKNGITKLFKIVKGGDEHERSIINGVAGLEGVAKPDDVVIIHLAVSPLLTDEIITDSIRVCKEKGNAISAYDSHMLYASNDGDCAQKEIDRSSFKTLSHPQSFLYDVITGIYRQVEEKKMLDDYPGAHTITIMAKLGIPIFFAKGSHTNLKITTQEDIDLFLGYLLAQKYKNNGVFDK